MPSKYRIRNFEENGYYHIFNRGVEKRKIFLDDQDYKMFSYYLFVYLKPLDEILLAYPRLPIRLQAKNLSDEIDLISYCLMPNHFHLLLKQRTKNGFSKFIKQITNAYTEYFNKKYERTGSLMQGTFKSVKVNTDQQLIHLSRYIHLNPIVDNVVDELTAYPWSSYKDIISSKPKSLCKIEITLNLSGSAGNYEKFVKDQIDYAKELKKLEGLTVDD